MKSEGAKMPQVGIIMGSESDYETMRHAQLVLSELGIEHEIQIVSAHRTPDLLFSYSKTAEARGLRVIIAGAGGAAHLPGMVSSLTTLPVLGVPVQSKALNGLDSLLSIVQMPGGVPTATFAIGSAGARNAGLFAASILALSNAELGKRVKAARDALRHAVSESQERLMLQVQAQNLGSSRSSSP
jgi:5-(carboxyamino)imidazole ribonucleotide mutase